MFTFDVKESITDIMKGKDICIYRHFEEVTFIQAEINNSTFVYLFKRNKPVMRMKNRWKSFVYWRPFTDYIAIKLYVGLSIRALIVNTETLEVKYETIDINSFDNIYSSFGGAGYFTTLR